MSAACQKAADVGPNSYLPTLIAVRPSRRRSQSSLPDIAIISLLSLGGIVIRRVCWFLISFVRYGRCVCFFLTHGVHEHYYYYYYYYLHRR